MSTVKNHLSTLYAKVAGIHAKHKSIAESADDSRAADFHGDMEDCFKAACEECGGAENSKAAGGNDGKLAVQNVSIGELQEIRQGLGKLTEAFERFGSQVAPTPGIRGVIPDNPTRQKNTPIIRPGQPVVKTDGVAPEFLDLIKIDD